MFPFGRRARESDCAKALVQELCGRLNAPGKGVRAEDLISTLASITGELCMAAAGVSDIRGPDLSPGMRVFSESTNSLFAGDRPGATLDEFPRDSVVGMLRDRLLKGGYLPDAFPDVTNLDFHGVGGG